MAQSSDTVRRFQAGTIASHMAIGPIQVLRQANSDQRRTLLAAALGWMLDAFDAMLYALVLAHIMRDLSMSKAVAGSLAMLTLLASGIGGVLFGFLADHIGRKRALMLSIFSLLVRIRARHQHSDVGSFSIHSRPRDGRRVEHRGDAGR